MNATTLPHDLLRLILEESFTNPATLKRQQLDLMVLRKDIYAWLAPLFYRHVVLDSTSEDQPEDTAICKFLALPPRSLALVKSVCATRSIGVPAVLEACPNIHQLALRYWCDMGERSDRIFSAHSEMLRRLSVSLNCRTEGPTWTCAKLQSPLFATLTHLDLRVYDWKQGPWRSPFVDSTCLRELVNLTHWAVDLKRDYMAISLPEVVDALIPQLPPNLLVLIMGYTHGDHHELPETWLAKGCDPRLVFRVGLITRTLSETLGKYDMAVHHHDVPAKRWDHRERDVREGDLWEAAEQLVQKRLGRMAAPA